MRKIKAWETTDGVVHKNETEAREYQNELDRTRGIKGWVDRYCHPGMTMDDIAEVLMHCGEELGV